MHGETARGEDVASAHPPRFMRRHEAAEYLTATYGFGAYRTLSKGVVTGDTPRFRKAGRLVLYVQEDLDAWALSKIGPPRKSSSASAAA